LTFFKQAYILNYFAMLLLPTWIIYRQVRGERAAINESDGELKPLPVSTA
jgi:hypothetical protein